MTWNLYYFWKAHFKLKFPLMIMLVIPDSVLYITLLFGLLQNIYDNVSCRWWKIHHGPHSTTLFMSSSTPYPGIRIRSQVNYLGLACVNGRLPCFHCMSLHHWLLIQRCHQVFESNSFIHIRWYVLRYLGNHWNQWWLPSHLLTVYIIDWWSSGFHHVQC